MSKINDLPKELYLYIFILADDLNSTKALRLASKTAYYASYNYFKLLLRDHVFIYYNYKWCFSNKDPNMKEILEKQKNEPVPAWASFCHGDDSNSPGKPMVFKTTISNLYNTFYNYKI